MRATQLLGAVGQTGGYVMAEPESTHWEDEYTGRERVRTVVETLEEPAIVTEIANRANVAWVTADSELENLLAEQRVRKHEVDGKIKYGLNPLQQLFDELVDLITEHTREELETNLVEYQSQRESLQAEFDVGRLTELRDTLIQEDLSAEEMRAVRNAASTWETLETEIRLTKHALQLYDDVTRSLDSDGDELVS